MHPSATITYLPGELFTPNIRVRVRGIRTRITFIYYAKLNNIVFAPISGSFVASGFTGTFYHNFAET